MTRGRAAGFLSLVLAFAAASWVGWWMVPAVALLWGALRPAMRRPAATAALAAAAAAMSWLAVNAVSRGGSLSILADRMAQLMSLPVPVLLLATVLIPALLAWSGTAAGTALRAHAKSPTPQPNS